MKQAVPNMREIVAEIRAALPGFPAHKQTELDAFALRIAGELDILEGVSARVEVTDRLDLGVPDTDPGVPDTDPVLEKPAEPAKITKAPAAE